MLPLAVANDYPLLERGGAKVYRTASKHSVHKAGERDLVLGFQPGNEMATSWEVGDIAQPLSAVSKMVRAGNRVVFDAPEHGGSHVYNHRTQDIMALHEKEGVYVLPAWIKPGPNASSSRFRGHAARQ